MVRFALVLWRCCRTLRNLDGARRGRGFLRVKGTNESPKVVRPIVARSGAESVLQGAVYGITAGQSGKAHTEVRMCIGNHATPSRRWKRHDVVIRGFHPSSAEG